MGLFAPLALLALPLLGLIIALYLLRFRRPVAPVGSLYLWESLTRDREANSLWQRLHISTLLLLQLLAMLALILSLARPWVTSAEAAGQNAIIVVDLSASMSATDGDGGGPKTRLDAALDKARSLVDDLPQGASASLITADHNATVLVPSSDDKSRLRAALGTLRPHATSTDLTQAMQLASAVAVRQPNSTIWVLSDGVFPAVALSETPQAQVRFFPVGHGGANQGITGLSSGQQAGSFSVFVQLVNSDAVTATRRLDLSVDDAPWNARTVTLGPGETQQVILDDLPLGARVVAAKLAGEDAMELDNSAWTVNRASVPANVLLVTGGNKFLELAVSLLPNVTLYKVAPGAYTPDASLNGDPFDLTIFDTDVPTATLQKLPDTNLLFVGPQGSTPLFAVSGQVAGPVPSFSALDTASSGADANAGAEERDPLLRFVDLSSLHVSRAGVITVPTWAHVVLGSDKGPLIVAGQQGSRKVGVLAFDLHDSDLPVQTAYPLLMRNLVTSLLPDTTGGIPIEVAPGAVVGVEAASGAVDRALVEDPSGKEWNYPLTAGRRRVAFSETGGTGVYYVTQYAGENIEAQEAFVINLTSRDESLITPNAKPGLPKGVAQVARQGSGDDGGLFKREMWPVVAGLGFGVLLLEWLFAQRMAIRRALAERRARRALRRLENA